MIAKQIEKTIKKGFGKIAKKENIDVNKIQVLIKVDEKTEDGLSYLLIKDNKPAKNLSFEEVIGVKVDLLRLKGAVVPILQNSIEAMSQVEEISKENIGYMIVFRDGNLHYFLFNCFAKVRKMEIDEVISAG